MIPDVKLNVQDGALGLTGSSTDAVMVKLGVSSLGTVNQVLSISQLSDVPTLLGTGPLAESVATHLALSGAPLLVVPLSASVAGTLGVVAHVGAGAGTVVASGTPLDAYAVLVTLTRPGLPGAAAFTLSLDGGLTTSAETSVPSGGAYPVPGTGLTLTFAGAFVAGDTYAYSATAPASTLGDLNAGIDALFADPRQWSILHVVGTATATVAAAVAVRMTEAKTRFRYVSALLEARDISAVTDTGSHATWQSNLLTEWATFADVRVGVAAGFAQVVSPLTARVNRVSIAATYLARLAAIAASEHPGYVARGPLAGIVKLFHDEQLSQGLDAAGFTTARTIIGRQGFYITNGRIMAPAGSDYPFIELRRVMDKACSISRNAALEFLNTSVRVDALGQILDADAAAIEGYIEGQLRSILIADRDASNVSVTLQRDSNPLTTRSAKLTTRVEPLAYLSNITEDIGYINPALRTLTAGA